MARIHGESDVDARALAGQRVAVLGYGSQGRAQALNLRDSGCDVVVGLRRGRSWARAEADGWAPTEPSKAVASADVVAMLAPDLSHAALYRDAVAPHLRGGGMLLFAHGFSVHYGQVDPSPDTDIVLVAPKSPGDLVRRQFGQGRGVPCLVGVHRDASGRAWARTLAYAHSIGGTRAGAIETTFAEETETDLFGEQAVLCGGLTELVSAGWETLVAAGYQPEVAYFECLHELKLIVDLLYEGGFERMHGSVSETARFGDLTRGPRVVDEAVRRSMGRILEEVRSGAFAREWIQENRTGRPNYERLLARDLGHPIESIGREVRARMSWLSEEGRR